MTIRCGKGLVGLALIASGVSAAQTTQTRAPYLNRGDRVQQNDSVHRANLQKFYATLHPRVEEEAPDLLGKLEAPTETPYGYQMLPTLLPPMEKLAATTRLRLSPFSWSRTESLLDRDRAKLDTLNLRLANAPVAPDTTVHTVLTRLVNDYRTLLNGQKLIENQIGYNRFWQGEFALHPERYPNVKSLQAAAIERQAFIDSIASGDATVKARLQPKADSIAKLLAKEIRKAPAPDFVRVVHPTPHQWVVIVPMYTDITDSGFVESFRGAIESEWHVTDGPDDFRVRLGITRLKPSLLYGSEKSVPPKGTHIDFTDHLRRFPTNAVVLTTGASTTHVLGRAIILAPYPTARSVLAHEFGHQLGFKDAYFRSYEDRGAEGYDILEVILPPGDGVPAPESGWIRREHFDQIISEKLK